MSFSRQIAVLTHGRPKQTADALRLLIAQAAEAATVLRFDEQETAKHALRESPTVLVNAPFSDRVELCIALGGDGTILRALQLYAGTGVPVFGVNFGEIGFLSTIEPEDLEEGLRRAFAGEFKLLRLPAIVLQRSDGEAAKAINDVALHRRTGGRVAEIAYALGEEVLGSVRCDGLVVATPAGSTGYNLANGGPVMAWGVKGYVVSFIAPHSLTARPLVAAPADVLTISNRSVEVLEISVDGRPAGEIEPGGSLAARFVEEVATLAQMSGSSFHRRLHEKFGSLSR